MDSSTISTKEGMYMALPGYIATMRTTLCDIMCTRNTAFMIPDPMPKKESDQVISAAFPYTKPYGLVGPVIGSTKFQKYKIGDIKQSKILNLKRDRDEYMSRLQQEKSHIEFKRRKAAILIQAIFRGFRRRKNRCTYVPKRKPMVILSQTELQDDLCQKAADLKLSSIPGLNLEWRMKASKRKVKIDNAAAFRITRFFQMLFEKKKAQAVVAVKKIEYVDKKAKVITKAIRYMKTKNFVKRIDFMKREKSAVVMQSYVRRHQSSNRVNEMLALRAINLRRNEAAIIIQRNFASRHHQASVAEATSLSMRSLRKFVDISINKTLDILIKEYLNEEIAPYVQGYGNTLFMAVEKCLIETANEIVDNSLDIEVIIHTNFLLEEEEKERIRVLEEKKRQDEITSMIQEEQYMQNFLEDEKRIAQEMLEEARKTLINSVVDDIISASSSRVGSRQSRRHSVQLFVDDMIQSASETLIPQAQIEEEGTNEDYEQVFEDNTQENTQDDHTNEEITQEEDPFPPNPSQGYIEFINGMAEEFTNSMIHSAISIFTADTANNSVFISYEPSLTASEIDPFNSNVQSVVLPESVIESIIENQQPSVSESLEEEEKEEVEGGEGDKEKMEDPQPSLEAEKVKAIAIESNDHINTVNEFFKEGKFQMAINTVHPIVMNLESLLPSEKLGDISTIASEQNTIEGSAVAPQDHTSKGDISLFIILSVLLLLEARSCQELAQYEDSFVLFHRVLHVRQRILGNTHYLVGEVFHYLARWYHDFGIFAEAQSLYGQADKILSKAMNAEDMKLSQMKNKSSDEQTNLIPPENTELETKDITDEDGIPKKEMSSKGIISQRATSVFKLYHRNLLSYHELLRSIGHYYKAQELLKFIEKNLGYYKDNYNMVSFEIKEEILFHLFDVLIMRGKYKQAKVLHQELLTKKRTYYKHARAHKLLNSYFVLIKICMILSEFDEAVQCLEEIQYILSEYYPLVHPYYGQLAILKSELFVNISKYPEALAELQQAYNLFIYLFQQNPNFVQTMDIATARTHPMIGEIILQFAKVYNEMGEPFLAQHAVEDGLIIFNDLYNGVTIHLMVVQAHFQWALSCMLKQNFLQAKDHFIIAYSQRKMILSIHAKNKSLDSEEPIEYLLLQMYLLYVTVLSTIQSTIDARTSSSHSLLRPGNDTDFDALQNLEDLMTNITLDSTMITGTSYRKDKKIASVIAPTTTTMSSTAENIQGNVEQMNNSQDVLDILAENPGLQVDQVQSHEELTNDPIQPALTNSVSMIGDQSLGLPRQSSATQFYDLMMTNIKKIIKKMSKVLGKKNNLSISQGIKILAEISKYKGNYLDAKELIHVSYDLMLNAFTDDHLFMSLLLLECSDNLRLIGYFEEALEINKNAISLYLTVMFRSGSEEEKQSLDSYPAFGSSPSSSTIHYLALLLNLAKLYRDIEIYSHSEEIVSKIIQFYLVNNREFCGLYASAVSVLADLYRIQRRFPMAERSYLQALTVAQAIYSEQSMIYIDFLQSFSVHLIDSWQFQRAYDVLSQSIIPVYERMLGMNHLTYLYARVNLTMAYRIIQLTLEDQSLTSQRIATLLAEIVNNSSDIQYFFTVWMKLGLNEKHPWIIRLKQIASGVLPSDGSNSLDSRLDSIREASDEENSVQSQSQSQSQEDGSSNGFINDDGDESLGSSVDQERKENSETPYDQDFEQDENHSLNSMMSGARSYLSYASRIAESISRHDRTESPRTLGSNYTSVVGGGDDSLASESPRSILTGTRSAVSMTPSSSIHNRLPNIDYDISETAKEELQEEESSVKTGSISDSRTGTASLSRVGTARSLTSRGRTPITTNYFFEQHSDQESSRSPTYTAPSYTDYTHPSQESFSRDATSHQSYQSNPSIPSRHPDSYISGQDDNSLQDRSDNQNSYDPSRSLTESQQAYDESQFTRDSYESTYSPDASQSKASHDRSSLNREDERSYSSIAPSHDGESLLEEPSEVTFDQQ